MKGERVGLMWIHAVAILLRSGNLSHNRGRPLGENVVNRRRFIELREMAAEQL